MNILQKTLLILAIFFAALLLVFFIVSQTILLRGYLKLETEDALRNLERAERALEREVEELDRFTADWAHWDDTYAFAADPEVHSRYPKINLVDATFADGPFNYILFYELSGEVIYGKGFDPEEGEERMVPREVDSYFAESFTRLPPPGNEDRLSGLLLAGEEPLLFSARPILTSEKEGPARGWMVMGRYLSPALREKLEEITQLELVFYPAGEELPAGVPSPGELQEAVAPLIRFPDRDNLAAYQLLPDAAGDPGLLLEVRIPREITRQGLETIGRYFFWFLLAFAFTLGLTACSLHRYVIRPARRLIGEIDRIGEDGEFSARLPARGADELSRLARALNRMLGALEKATADLRRSEERYRGVVEDQTELICRFLPGGAVTFSNRAFDRASEETAAVPAAPSFYHRLPEREREPLRKALDGLPADGPPLVRELAIGRGEDRRVEQWTFRVLRSGPVRGMEIQAVGRDITRQKELEERLRNSHKLESLGTLAGGIAHDFNNVLTAILGNISLARTWSGPAATPVSEVLEEAEKACLQARGLTNQLLTFSSGGRPVKSLVRLGPAIEQSARMALSGSAVRGTFRIGGDLWPAEADEGQIGQVIHNLVLNAVQAMPGGGEVEIAAGNFTVDAGEKVGLPGGTYLKIVVRDGGVGIPEEIRGRIFDPYFTTKQAGSGLGLAVVYSIVRNHGGEIIVGSAPGRGSAFTIFLPAAPGREVPPADESLRPIRGEGKILVMDDEPQVRRAACLMLADLGYTPVGVGDGREMIEVYRQARESGDPFAAVIVDLTVRGGLGGLEANRELLRHDPEAVTIVTSGYSSDPAMERYREEGFRGAIPKPYRLSRLGEALASVLSPRPTG